MHNAGKMIFPARKLMNYLVVPNNLLLSLSLSLSLVAHLASTLHIFLIRTRARFTSCPQSTKGITDFPLCDDACLFVNPRKRL